MTRQYDGPWLAQHIEFLYFPQVTFQMEYSIIPVQVYEQRTLRTCLGTDKDTLTGITYCGSLQPALLGLLLAVALSSSMVYGSG